MKAVWSNISQQLDIKTWLKWFCEDFHTTIENEISLNSQEKFLIYYETHIFFSIKNNTAPGVEKCESWYIESPPHDEAGHPSGRESVGEFSLLAGINETRQEKHLCFLGLSLFCNLFRLPFFNIFFGVRKAKGGVYLEAVLHIRLFCSRFNIYKCVILFKYLCLASASIFVGTFRYQNTRVTDIMNSVYFGW